MVFLIWGGGFKRTEIMKLLSFLKFCVFACLFTVFGVFARETASFQKYYTIESQTARELVISFEFDDLLIKDAAGGAANIKSFEISGLSANYSNDQPLLPMLALPLTLPEGKVSFKLLVEESQVFPGLFPPTFHDTPNQPEKAKSKISQTRQVAADKVQAFKRLFPRQIYELNELGLFRDVKISALQIYPVQVTGNGVRFYKKFKLRLSFQNTANFGGGISSSESRLLKGLVANKQQLHLVSPQNGFMQNVTAANASITATADRRLKLFIAESGIYQITGQDLLEAEIDISSIDPLTLRLSNKGRNIAIFQTGDQDGMFDPEDVFEFWGEPNEKTFIDEYPDAYADPFTDINVYWLEWGGAPGLRMIEENGSLITSRPGEFNPSFFYSHTEHIERNNHFERLGQANPEQLSFTRDLWFFDSGIKAIGKKQYPFELVYPDPSSFQPVEVTAMFSGKSFGQRFNGQRVPHNVQVWLNNGFVGHSDASWVDQDTARISTNAGNANLRTTDLIHGVNNLEVQLPTLPNITVPSDTGFVISKGTDIVLLNWFDVTYDRLYKAHENEIEFRRPAFIAYQNTDLFQYDIDNFSTADIDIYKKDVSKIVNYRIDLETENGQNNFKISFQDDAPSDDIQYIALAKNRKKKPFRIEKDNPFDAENPERLLRDGSNSAEYIIITHNRFLDNARQLLDHRRSSGLAAELIDVQEIYDEFNFGLKSPLAIKDFLRYAFFNWNRSNRLKYVLLLGDANFDYKATNPLVEDLVPTFLFQTQDFGASASDYPYGLVSGDDEIPDLFVGRIPAATNNDLNSAISKIIEYETTAPNTSWRNQALFISGNDRTTFELANILGATNHAFRSQNLRVIETILPNHISSARLNTIRDENLPFDPNFGTDSDLIDHWDDGLFLINFMGHGGGGIWADVELMSLADVDRLNNRGMYPFVTSMTCFTGAFENPGQLGLAQKLMLAPERGAIGILASSGLGYLHNDYAMMWSVGQFMFDRSLTIGEQMALGKIFYLGTGQFYNVDGRNFGTPGYFSVKSEMVNQYNLIGDPYTSLKYAEDVLNITLNTTTPQRGDTLQIRIDSPFSGDGYVEMVDFKFDIVDRIPLFGASQVTEIEITVPENFPDGKGFLRAYLSNGSEDASGKAEIGVNHAAVSAVTFEPARPDTDDSVRVNLRINDFHGIKRVYLFREDNQDSIFAVNSPQDTSLYTAVLPPTFQLQTVFFNLHVENNIGNISLIPNLSYVVTDIRPDISFVDNSLQFTGNKKTGLKVGIENPGGAGEDNTVTVRIHFADGADNFQAENYFNSTDVSLSAADSTTITVDFPLQLNRQNYTVFARAEVAAGEDVRDFNPENNTISTVLTPTIFNVSPQSGSDTIFVDSNYKVYFPPGSVSDSTAVRVKQFAFEKPADQKGLLPVSIVEAGAFHALEVTLLNKGAVLNQPFRVDVELNPALIDTTTYPARAVKLYQKVQTTQPWTSTLFAADNNFILSANVQKSASFAPFITTDLNSPRIELTVDGRPVLESGLVSSNPSLYLSVQDESGVNLQRDEIVILIDNNALPQDKVLIPDSVQNNSALGIALFPELSNGAHLLKVNVKDVNGNSAQQEFELVVAEGFDIHVYGNYPNPFQDQTIFTYFVDLNDDLDEFEIRIYTVSGRFIRKIDSDINNPVEAPDGGARRKGYNELIWDGTDKDGNPVANGVYFAVVKASYEGETIEKIMKVAKLR